ncbi:MAG: hypothetical protein A3J27_08635 [Candidatus Tectomicrobia bacterium RIFCSPLOWO2_12_FULL_69_37]|nr:MAG: hypothetical protein A3J27_08635 [Candidatus Tectomicrobia bacterium RIFCSPLOWO2_12_FULL_69_37]
MAWVPWKRTYTWYTRNHMIPMSAIWLQGMRARIPPSSAPSMRAPSLPAAPSSSPMGEGMTRGTERAS